MAFESDVITVEAADHVATLWLDRPEKLNACGPPFWHDLPLAVEALGADPDVRVVIVAAMGKAFTVGLDLEAFAGMATGAGLGGQVSVSAVDGRRRLLSDIKMMQRTMTSVERCPKPVIAAVHGYCIGAGVDLITACDIRLAASDAQFSVRETKLAMVADVGTLQRLPRVVSDGHVAELAYTGKDISADKAFQIGLVNDVYPDHDSLLKAARELGDEIAANSPLAVQGIKQVLRAGKNLSMDEALDYAAVWNAAFLHSDDLGEAIRAFLEKRPARFKGS